MHAVAALVLTLVAAVACAAPDPAFIAWSLDTCRSDTVCALRWRLPTGSAPLDAYDVARFGEMMAVFVARHQDSDVGYMDALATCVANDSTPGCTIAQLLWLGMLRHAEICNDNEEWVLNHGCECMDGKQCVADCTQAVIDNLWPFTLAVGVLGVVVLLFFIWDIRKANEMARVSAERFQQTLTAHYTLQAHLYLAAAAPAAISAQIGSGYAL